MEASRVQSVSAVHEQFYGVDATLLGSRAADGQFQWTGSFGQTLLKRCPSGTTASDVLKKALLIQDLAGAE